MDRSMEQLTSGSAAVAQRRPKATKGLLALVFAVLAVLAYALPSSAYYGIPWIGSCGAAGATVSFEPSGWTRTSYRISGWVSHTACPVFARAYVQRKVNLSWSRDTGWGTVKRSDYGRLNYFSVRRTQLATYPTRVHGVWLRVCMDRRSGTDPCGSARYFDNPRQ